MNRVLRTVIPATVAAAGAALMVAAPALAGDQATVSDTGWWYRANTGLVAIAPPDVAEDQLLVEGTPEGASAIAAVSADLADGTGKPLLTLPIASSTGTVSIVACQAGSAWTGVDGGAWDAAPTADCTQSVQGILAEDGSSLSFALAPLQFGQEFSVVFVPGTADGSAFDGTNGATMHVVLDKPTGDQIAAVGGVATAPNPVADETVAGGSFSPPTTVAATSFAPGSSRAPTFSPPPTATTFTGGAAAALPRENTGLTATAPVVQASTESYVPVVSTLDDATDTTRLRLLGLGVLLAGLSTGFLWWRQDTAVPLRAVVTGLTPAELEAHLQPTATVGGLARFRRERTGDAPTLF